MPKPHQELKAGRKKLWCSVCAASTRNAASAAMRSFPPLAAAGAAASRPPFKRKNVPAAKTAGRQNVARSQSMNSGTYAANASTTLQSVCCFPMRDQRRHAAPKTASIASSSRGKGMTHEAGEKMDW